MIIGAVVAIPLACGCASGVAASTVPIRSSDLRPRTRPGQQMAPRAGHMDGERLLWRRLLPWWWQQVRLGPARVEPVVDRHRGPLEAIFVASDAVIVPVALRTGERLEMAMLPADLDRALAQLRQLTG